MRHPTSSSAAPGERRSMVSAPASTPASGALRYADPRTPGISRRRAGGRFVYLDPSGRRITDREEIARIERLAIPPAYRDVWICPDPRGHLQATGRDARGRLQYRYHRDWIVQRSVDKYCRLSAFGEALPRIRAAIEADLARPGLDRDKVMATVLALLGETFVRIGNARYRRENRSFGLTTLENRHVDVDRDRIAFRFRGKAGIEHRVDVAHRRLAAIVRRCRELPGQTLFQYLDDAGSPHPVTSDDVNAYLRSHGGEFTAKDFRTWAGSVLALARFRALPRDAVPTAAAVTQVVEEVARALGNTPTVCRKCYIHPRVIDAYLAGTLAALPQVRARKFLDRNEAALLALLARDAAGECGRVATPLPVVQSAKK